MTIETIYRLAFTILFAALIAMRVYFMVRVRRAGERLMPGKEAIAREGGRGVLIVRVVVFFLLMAFLAMYIAGMAWIDAFSFPLPGTQELMTHRQTVVILATGGTPMVRAAAARPSLIPTGACSKRLPPTRPS